MQAAGGINRYFANLISRLPNDFQPTLLVVSNNTVNWPQHPSLQIARFKEFRPWRISSRLKPHYLRAVSNRNYDLIHPTYYQLLGEREMSACRQPIVLTVYDMIHENLREWTEPTGVVIEFKRKAILAAQAIICISQHTKNDLLELYPQLEAKISVTYLASELDASLAHGPEAVPERPYFLYVGSRARYKNFASLLLALAALISSGHDIALCVVGPPLDAPEQQRIADLGLSAHIEHYGYANDAQLAKLYRCSVAFVYPSLYEGFGIPPLEAMACGALVVAGDNSSIPEVVGDAGLLFDATKVDELTDILHTVLNGSVPRDELIHKGQLRAQSFTWESTVAQTLDVYRSVGN